MSHHKHREFDPTAVHSIYRNGRRHHIKRWVYFVLAFLVVLLFLPWTQNIRAKGKVTTLYQSQRPQEMDVIIGGRILKWWIKEGDYVKKGDTLVQIAEVKDEYFDPNLVERTQLQINAKAQKASSYNQKASAYSNTIPALMQQRSFKLEQLGVKRRQIQLKVTSDSAELAAAEVDLRIAQDQFSRGQTMFNDGVISKVELEKRTNTFQKANALVVEKSNKLDISRRDISNNMLETFSTTQEYAEKIFKAQAEQSSSVGEAANTESEIAKLNIQLSNYKIRKDNYFILAPQDGQVIKVKKAGINEIVKEGEMLLEVVPSVKDYAVELFIDPMDQVLIDTGQEVRFIFDGYPAIVFSGWPKNSYGTFVGKIKTIETNSQGDGTFRIMVVPKNDYRLWPPSLRLGTAAQGFALLKDVPVWYELWRNINGFPPDYYKNHDGETKAGKQ
jgi:multidrug resistance efflux pump